MKKFKMISALIIGISSVPVIAEEDYVIGWSHYTGWEPIGYMASSGIMEKYNEKYNVNVEIKYIGDYIDSLTLYTSGDLNGVAVTNMDVMAIPAVGGRHSTSIVVGDYSNGNDGVVLKGYKTMAEAEGESVNIVEYSVSHYLLARCAEMNSVDMDSFELVNTTDADIPNVIEGKDKAMVVSWNPMLNTIMRNDNVNLVCSSKDIPGEIIDMIVVGDEVSENARMAISDAWYETMKMLKSGQINEELANQAGSSVKEFSEQLVTTEMMYEKKDAHDFVNNKNLKETMKKVINFSFNAGIYDGVDSAEELGVKFSDGSVWGNEENIGLTFSTKY